MSEPPEEGASLGDEAYYRDAYGDRSPEHYLWLLAEIVKRGRPGNILDLGCGPALFVEIAWRWGLDVTGCDGSGDALRIARRRQPKLPLALCLLGGALPFEANAFDNVVLNQVIEHLPIQVLSKVFVECRRVLRKDGMLFIHSPNKAHKREVRKDPTHVNPLYPSELRKLLVEHEFAIVLEPNSPRFSVRMPLLSSLPAALLKTRVRDWISATSNAYARKQ